MTITIIEGVENIVGKGGNVTYKYFLHFQQNFSKDFFINSSPYKPITFLQP